MGEDALAGGNLKFIGDKAAVTEEMKQNAERLSEDGKTPLFFSRNGELAGIMLSRTVIKEDSPQAIKELQNMGIHVSC